MNDGHKDDQLEKLLEDLRQKRENPDAIRVTDIEPEATGEIAGKTTQDERETETRRSPVVSRPEHEEVTQTSEFDFVKPKDRDKKKKSSGSASAKLAKREILGALNAGDDELEYDPINKSMVPPSIEQAQQEDEAEEQERSKRIAQAVEESELPEHRASHPLFTQSYSKEMVIPEETEEDAQRRKEQQKFETSELILDGYVQQAEKKGILNVKDNLDDNFREFFGDTVVIDKQSLSEKAQKTRKVRDYVIAETADDIGGPIFEDRDEGIERNIDLTEYSSEEDEEQVLQELTAQKRSTTLRMVVLGVLSLLAGGMSLLAVFGKVPSVLAAPRIFYVINGVLVVLAISINIKQVFSGLGKLVSFKADAFSLGSFAAFAALCESVALAVVAPEVRGTFGCVVVIGYFFVELGRFLNINRILSGFQSITSMYDKYASSLLEDEQYARSMTRGLDVSGAQILLRRPTGFTNHFIAHSFSDDGCGKKVAVLGSVSVLVSLACGVLAYFLKDATVVQALSTVCGCAVLAFPFAATLTGVLPIYIMHRATSKVGAIIPGYSAVYEIDDANCVVLEGREFFPKGNVMMHGIKTFDRERIDTAILYAASVIIQACDTMSHMFMNVIQGKTEMLYEVSGIEYESGLGFSYWIDKKHILLGTRDLLEKNGIEVPSRDYESRYTKTNTRDAMYLAVGGRLYAMFVISYSANTEVMEALAEFEKENLNILIHTRDFNITAQRIAKLYKIPESMVTLVREEDAEELTRLTEYAPSAPSSLTHVGSLTSFIKGVSASHNVLNAVRLSTLVEFIGLAIGLLFGVILTLIGALTTLGMLPVLLFQLGWCLILVIVVIARRY